MRQPFAGAQRRKDKRERERQTVRPLPALVGVPAISSHPMIRAMGQRLAAGQALVPPTPPTPTRTPIPAGLPSRPGFNWPRRPGVAPARMPLKLPLPPGYGWLLAPMVGAEIGGWFDDLQKVFQHQGFTRDGWNGWTFYWDCGTRPLDEVSFYATCSFGFHNCLGGQATGGHDMGTPVPSSSIRTAVLGYRNPAGSHHTSVVWYKRTDCSSAGLPQVGTATPRYVKNGLMRPRLAPEGLPEWAPSVSPEVVLPGSFMHPPAPVPYRVIPHRVMNPGRSPDEQTQFGNGAKPKPAEQPSVADGGVITITPGQPPHIDPGRFTKREPPLGRMKEKKVMMPRGKLMQLIGAITEGLDVTNALYEAIPEKLRPRRPTTQMERFRILWSQWRDVNIIDAIGNLIVEDVTDAGVALVSRHARGAFRGPWDTEPQRWQQEYNRNERAARRKDAAERRRLRRRRREQQGWIPLK